MDFSKLPEVILLALCIFGEARGEPLEGKIAVGLTVRNRVVKNHSSYYAEILKPYQFSCFNKDDPNYKKICHYASRPEKEWQNSKTLRDCLLAAKIVMEGISDFTNGATHYFATYCPTPSWLKGFKFCGQYGRHLFWKKS